MKERGRGIPRGDIERAMSHYNISEAEYRAHPENYPLPARGTGFGRGTAADTGFGLGALVVIVLLILGLTRRR